MISYYIATDRFGNYDLAHHGVLGMKWGVRRYQNADGSLTPAGRKRYSNPNAIYKDAKKSIREKRSEQYGSSHKYAGFKPIGSNSSKLISDSDKKRKEYVESEEFKKWEKEYDRWEKKAEKLLDDNDNDFSWEDYDRQQKELWNRRPKKNFNDPFDYSVRLGMLGKEYTDHYLNGAGKDMSIAYLKDLGFNDKTAKELVKRLIAGRRTLGGI